MTKERLIVICGSGEDYSTEKLAEYCGRADVVIASDGGYDSLHKLGIRPDYLLGDFDSIKSSEIDESIEIERYRPEKDYSDSELAVMKALELKAARISLFGLTGSYFDHSFANVINLFKYCNDSVNIEIITSNSRIFSILDRREFLDYAGRRCSLFPLSEIKGLKMEGFKYLFKGDSLSWTDYSLSNVIDSDYALVEFSEGRMFCVLFDEGFS